MPEQRDRDRDEETEGDEIYDRCACGNFMSPRYGESCDRCLSMDCPDAEDKD